MARVVAVHGALHELWGPNQLRSRWLPAVRDGLWHVGATIDDDDFVTAFYGDIFRPDPEEPTLAVGLPSRVGLVDTAMDEGGDILAQFADAVGRETFHRMIEQTGRYFTVPSIREQVRARIEDVVTDDTRVLVAHSMGSVVAYETLCAHPEWPVTTFLTVGSPLGRGLVLPRLTPSPLTGAATWPAGLRQWDNLLGIGDRVTGDRLLSQRLNPRIRDRVVDNGLRTHDAEPYLNNPRAGAAILAGLRGSPRLPGEPLPGQASAR